MRLSLEITGTMADSLDTIATLDSATREEVAREAIQRHIDRRRGAVYVVMLCGMDDTYHHDYDEAMEAWGNASAAYIESLIKRGMSREQAKDEAEIDVGLGTRYTD